jgi:hypothetical protein
VSRLYWRANLLLGQQGYDGGDPLSNEAIINQERRAATKEDANLISSLTDDGFHMPAIDLDLPTKLVPSSTEGHYHLFIDHKLSAENYWKLLSCLVDVGIVERGFYELSEARGASFLRTHRKGEREGMTDPETNTDESKSLTERLGGLIPF